MEMKHIEFWPKKKKNSIKIRVDPEFQDFILREFPNIKTNAERTRRLLGKLLYGRR